MSQKKFEEKKLWNAVLATLQVDLSETNFKTWLANTKAQNLTAKSLEIIFPNTHAKRKVEKLFRPMIQESVNKIGKGEFTLFFKVGTIKTKKQTETAPGPLFSSQQQAESQSKKNGLNPFYTLENYVMGDSNQLAYAIATAITREPGTKYNPFFLYSGVGNGKTHLIHAIGNKLIQKFPDSKIIYCTSEKFTNELIEAIKKGRGRAGEFRKKYRSVDVLIIDDIQFLAKKEATQEEFFHTFNDLFMAQKQIIITSDRPPEAFKNIEERITSRFKSGMMVDIQSPNYELRTAILRAKRDEDKENVPNEIIDFIAENVDTNIRELEGSYLQVITFAQARGEKLTIDTAKLALNNIIKEDRNKPVNLNTILKAVCNYYSVTQADVKGKRRTKEFVIPRQVAMYLMYELTGTPYMSIGELLGGRDHSTVMHGHEKIKTGLEASSKVREDIINIKQFVYQN